MAISLSRIIIIILLINSIFSPDLSSKNFDTRKAVLPRIGEHISKNERDYFRLFPKIENFKSAEVSINEAGEYVFDVEYDSLENTKSRSYFLSDDIYDQLSNAIDNYEYIFDKNNGTEKIRIDWTGLIDTIIKPEFRYYSDRKNEAVINTINGQKYKGVLFWADTNSVVIDSSWGDYNWPEAEFTCRILHYSEINEIKGAFNIDLFGDSTKYRENFADLSQKCSFKINSEHNNEPVPPEFEYLLRQKNMTANLRKYNIDPAIFYLDVPYGYQITPRKNDKIRIIPEITPVIFHQDVNEFMLMHRKILWMKNEDGSGYWETTEQEINSINFKNLNDNFPGFAIERNLFSDFGVGFTWSYYDPPKVSENSLEVDTKGNSFGIYAFYSPVTRALYPMNFLDDFFINTFAGVQITNYHGELQIPYLPSKVREKYKEWTKYDHSLLGIYAGIEIGYYLFTGVSIHAKAFVNANTTDKYIGMKYEYKTNYFIEIDPVDTKYFGAGLKFGFGLHI